MPLTSVLTSPPSPISPTVCPALYVFKAASTEGSKCDGEIVLRFSADEAVVLYSTSPNYPVGHHYCAFSRRIAVDEGWHPISSPVVVQFNP